MISVYLIRSERDGSVYCGVAQDVAARLALHNAGKGAKRTRGRGPWHLLGTRGCDSRGAALTLEAAVKRMSHADKLELAIRWELALA
jgi:putative endonuclease